MDDRSQPQRAGPVARALKSALAPHPWFAPFEAGRQPVYVTRFAGHGAGAAGRGVHAYAVIVLISSGRSRVRHSGELELQPGDVHVIPPGDAHSTPHFEHAAGWTLAFWPEHAKHSLRLFSRVRHGCHPVLRPTPSQRDRLERWLMALDEEMQNAAPGCEDAVSALLQLVLVELERADSVASQHLAERSSLARQALEHIEVHALGPLTLSDVAKALGRTPAHVATVVRRDTGHTVGDWILTRRMAEARRKLRSTSDGVDQIARQVGYADVTHFIRQFRRVHGVTPKQWQKTQGAPDAA